jgi:nucleoside 2-deoxyribosyltransferase
MYDVFISHSARDGALADIIPRELERLGRSVFIDRRDILPGQDFREALRTAIQESKTVLALISSPHAAANSWMGYEVGMAEALGKPVLTLASDRLALSDLPDDVSSRQIVNFDPQSPESAAREVVERLSHERAGPQ